MDKRLAPAMLLAVMLAGQIGIAHAQGWRKDAEDSFSVNVK